MYTNENSIKIDHIEMFTKSYMVHFNINHTSTSDSSKTFECINHIWKFLAVGFTSHTFSCDRPGMLHVFRYFFILP